MAQQDPGSPRGAPEGPIGWVTGLIAEARLARRLGPVATSGGTAAGAHSAAQELVRQGARALVSFGICGALDPVLRPGDLISAETVIVNDCAFKADPALTLWLGGRSGTALDSPVIVASADTKRRLRRSTAADVVDMESGAVARVAASDGLPFAILRAVCDPADFSLPRVACLPLTRSGRVRPISVTYALASRPAELGDVVRLARHAANARRALLHRVDHILDRTR